MTNLLEFRSLAQELIDKRSPKAQAHTEEIIAIRSILRTATERNAAKETVQVQTPESNVWDNSVQHQQTVNRWAIDPSYQEMARAMGHNI